VKGSLSRAEFVAEVERAREEFGGRSVVELVEVWWRDPEDRLRTFRVYADNEERARQLASHLQRAGLETIVDPIPREGGR